MSVLTRPPESVRRIGLMRRISEGICLCVKPEHIALYRLIRTEQPDTHISVNSNGAFVPLDTLRTDVLERCYELVKHGLAQERKERLRQQQQTMLRVTLNRRTHGRDKATTTTTTTATSTMDTAVAATTTTTT